MSSSSGVFAASVLWLFLAEVMIVFVPIEVFLE